MTYFRLVSATVTTNTIDALPMITPSDVSAARNLFARKASMATVTISRTAIIAISGLLRLQEKTVSRCWPRPTRSQLGLAFFFQRFLRHFVFRIQLQGGLVFRGCFAVFPLLLMQPAQPVVRHRRTRVRRPHRRVFQVLTQQALGLFCPLVLQNQPSRPIELPPWVVGVPFFSRVRYRDQPVGFSALQCVVPDVVDQLG